MELTIKKTHKGHQLDLTPRGHGHTTFSFVNVIIYSNMKCTNRHETRFNNKNINLLF